MKRNLFALIGIVSLELACPAALILNEPFNYPNGPIITVSGGAWTTHSGSTPGQVDVQNGKVNLTSSESEDVNTLLPGGPYTNGTIYASFVINVTGLTNANGAYFAHFKDSGTGFRSRVYLATTNATAGFFRMGLHMLNSPVFIPTDLSTNTDYLIVIKQDFGDLNPSGSLWVNPTNEADTTLRVDVPADITITNVPAAAFALRQNSGMGTLTFAKLRVATTFGEVFNVNPPSVSFIADQAIPAGGSTGPIPFTVSDIETPAASLTLSAASTNLALIPVSNVVFGGSGSNRTVTVTPMPGLQGNALITVTARDGDGNTSSRAFTVRVGAPSLSTIAEQITLVNRPLGPLAFTVFDAESAPGSLTVTAASTNQTLVADSDIAVGGSGSNRTVTITPQLDQGGLTKITLTVSDGVNATSSSFLLTVAPQRGLELTDDFNYPDGSVVENSAFFWSRSSGATNQMVVIGGKLQVTGTQTEDVYSFLVNAPYAPGSGFVLYSKFEVNFSVMPTSANGEYFAHFKDSGSNFRARIFATTNGAAAGQFRLGIANGGTVPSAIFPMNLATNVTYIVVTRYNLNTTQSALWVNPHAESDAPAIATDSTSTMQVYSYAFRQTTAEGTMLVDAVRVGTAFSDVYVYTAPPQVKLETAASGSLLILSWPVADGFTLESADSLSAPNWQAAGAPTVIDNKNYVTNAMTGPSGFFRLKK